MRTYRVIPFILATLFTLTNCAEKTDPCAEVEEVVQGSFKGVALAYGGDATLAIPVEKGRCLVGVSGDFAFHREIENAAAESDFRYEIFSPIHLNLKGEIALVDRIPLFEGDEESQSYWFRVEGQPRVSNAVTRSQWEQQFELHFGMTLEEKEKWVESQRADQD